MIGPLAAAAAVLLAVAGLAKLRAPAPAATMIVALVPSLTRRRPAVRAFVRVSGVGEAGVGLSFVALGGRVPAGLLAAAYLAFTLIALRLATQPSGTPCGCFGAVDSPVGAAHVTLNLVALGVAAAAVARPAGALGGLLHHGPATLLIGGAQVLLLAWLGYLAITALPALASARRLEEAR